MSLFGSIFGGETYLGVDIGTTSIKLVEVKKEKKDRAALVNYGILETYNYLEQFNEALQTSSLKLLKTETAKYLRQLADRCRTKTNRVIVSLPAFSAFTTLIELPKMSDSEIAQVIKFQAKQYVPLSLSAVTIDWLKAGERIANDGVPRVQIFLIAMLNDQIARYKDIFKLANLEIVAVEIEGLSLARSLTLGVKELSLIIDIGARSSSFSIAQNGLLKFIGQTDFAGGSLTQVLSSGLNISVRRAEELKKQGGLSGGGAAQELSTMMKPLLDVIINEARRVKNNYEAVYQEPINKVILTGGGSRLLGIEKYIESQLNLPVEKGNPFSNIAFSRKIAPLFKDLGVNLATAIGLGLKKL